MDKLSIPVDKKALASSFGKILMSGFYGDRLMTSCAYSAPKELTRGIADKPGRVRRGPFTDWMTEM